MQELPDPDTPVDGPPRPADLTRTARAAWVQVELDSLLWNVHRLRAMAGASSTFAAVVKADAYGHGIEAASLAARAAGATYLSVATLDEAMRLRSLGDRAAIMVNYPIPADSLADAAAARVEVTAGSEADVHALEAAAHHAPVVHVEVDTGMGRGGFTIERSVDVIGRLDRRSVSVRAIWTHLASPDDAERTATQLRAFAHLSEELRALDLHPPVRHVSASGGLLLGAPAYELVRVGLAVYGVDPFPAAGRSQLDASLRPALSVRAHAVRIADVPVGGAVGYDGTWVASRPSRIATLPIGYVDGWTRAAGPRTQVLVRGVATPVVGRISSDSMTVDVTDVPDLDADDVFVLLGADGERSITVEDVAASRDTIVWEVLQTLSARLARVYMLDGEVVAQRSPATMRLSATTDLEAALGRSAATMERARAAV